MEKRAVWNPKIDCNAKITAANDCSVAETNCTKLVADEAQVFQEPQNCTAESSCSRGMLEGMVLHYIQSDQPSNLRLKAQSVNNCNFTSCRRDLSERFLDSKASVKQAQSYRQEFREHQIQQWVSKHSYAQESLPKDHWLSEYPHPRGWVNTTEISPSVQLRGGYQDLDTDQLVRQPQGFIKTPSNVDYVESSKKHVHFVSSNAIITDSCSLEASEGVSLRKRKFIDLKAEIDQDFPNDTFAADRQLNRAAGSEQPYLGEDSSGTGVTLRQWLSRRGRVVDCLESLNIFKQILQFVDLAHIQGVVLKNVRPSLFLLSSLHRVTFLDSASSSSSSGSSEPSTGAASVQASLLADTASKRVESASKSGERHFLNRGGEEHNQQIGWRTIDVEHAPILLNQIKASADRTHFGSESRACESGKAQMLDNCRDAEESPSDSKFQRKDIFPVRPTRLMEDLWYTSPEEIQDGTYSFASDIYSLGVLFFELFCPFSSWEEHSKIMLDFRHRILPPSLLSDQPKEAAFCLWLLHPEPHSRPKTRDVLQSDVLNDAGEALAERQDAMNIEEKETETEVLLDFLLRMRQQKRSLACKLTEELSCLTSDIMEVKRRRSCSQHSCTILDDQDPSSRITQEGASGGVQWSSKNLTSSGLELHEEDTDLFIPGLGNEVAVDSAENENYWGSDAKPDAKRKKEQLLSKSARLISNFDKFEEAYFAMRWNVQPQVSPSQTTQDASSGSAPAGSGNAFLEGNRISKTGTGSTQRKDSLGCFFDSLCKYARYSRFEVKATLFHGNLMNTSNMVCSLGFDRDQEYFATAGICRRIRVFDCDAVLNENVDIHYPVVEMTANSKLSSICWNSYIKSHVASSDYDGVVQLWDASTAQTLMQYKEHKKRAWSVDFSQADPTKLASGSDDGSVKLWSINQEGSIGTIKTEANVCCVQFPGDSAHLIAFGSADFKVYCYDLRNLRLPWCVLMDHSKAVSYVKFLDSNTIVSASTDNTLKLWELSRANGIGGACKTPLLTYSGHTNEKNFVGLSVIDGYIACGSETNEVFAYHKSLPMPVATHKFGWLDPLTGKNMGDDTGKFVSSVCWRAKSQTLVAANSLGNVKVLEMV